MPAYLIPMILHLKTIQIIRNVFQPLTVLAGRISIWLLTFSVQCFKWLLCKFGVSKANWRMVRHPCPKVIRVADKWWNAVYVGKQRWPGSLLNKLPDDTINADRTERARGVIKAKTNNRTEKPNIGWAKYIQSNCTTIFFI